jgi:hypothetical protein
MIRSKVIIFLGLGLAAKEENVGNLSFIFYANN